MDAEVIGACGVAAILTLAGSRWIDFLYASPTAPLSFPEEISRRARFRKPLLMILLGVSAINLADVPLPNVLYLAAAIFFLSLITFTDFEQYVIFDKMLLPFALAGILAVFHLNLPLLDRIFAALIGGGIFYFLAVVTNGGIGGGDIKLVAVLGIWLGSKILFNVVTIGCILGGVVALILILAKKKNRQSLFAYGPYFTLTTIYFLVVVKNL